MKCFAVCMFVFVTSAVVAGQSENSRTDSAVHAMMPYIRGSNPDTLDQRKKNAMLFVHIAANSRNEVAKLLQEGVNTSCMLDTAQKGLIVPIEMAIIKNRIQMLTFLNSNGFLLPPSNKLIEYCTDAMQVKYYDLVWLIMHCINVNDARITEKAAVLRDWRINLFIKKMRESRGQH